MGDMLTWAEREIDIACKRERKEDGTSEGDWSYGCACYDSALKAFKSLMEDGHSGFSIAVTKNILVRLIEGKPLTPIEDTDDIWDGLSYRNKDAGYTSYQCKRMSALFKDVYDDGRVAYKSNDYCYCVDIDNPNSTWHNGFVSNIIYEMFPITMPYMPGPAIKVYCEDFLLDKANGDYDHKAVLYCIKPDGERVDINRFFGEVDHQFVEITRDEYYERKARRIK
jgi:hypothetical protein